MPSGALGVVNFLSQTRARLGRLGRTWESEVQSRFGANGIGSQVVIRNQIWFYWSAKEK